MQETRRRRSHKSLISDEIPRRGGKIYRRASYWGAKRTGGASRVGTNHLSYPAVPADVAFSAHVIGRRRGVRHELFTRRNLRCMRSTVYINFATRLGKRTYHDREILPRYTRSDRYLPSLSMCAFSTAFVEHAVSTLDLSTGCERFISRSEKAVAISVSALFCRLLYAHLPPNRLMLHLFRETMILYSQAEKMFICTQIFLPNTRMTINILIIPGKKISQI